VSDVVNAEKCFSTLANFITNKVPQSRLATLLGDRLSQHVCELTRVNVNVNVNVNQIFI